MWIRRVTSAVSSSSAAYAESGTCTTYPTPPTSMSTWFGLFSASRPRSWPIIARQYCRFSFARQREVETSAAIFANEFGLRQDVALHGAFDVGLRRAGVQAEFRVEGIQLEEIAMRLARRRARTAIASFAEIIPALARSARKLILLRHSFRKFSRIRRKIVEHPVDPGSCGSVGIVHDQRKGLGIYRRIIPFQLRRNVRAVTSKFFRDRLAGGKGRAGNLQRHGSSFLLGKDLFGRPRRKAESESNEDCNFNAR